MLSFDEIRGLIPLETAELIALAALTFGLALIGVFLQWRRRRRTSAQTKNILIDGSNVMYWKGGIPDIEAVRAVTKALERHGYTAGVVFDANVGYKISDHHHNDQAMAALLGLPKDQVLVSPKGVTADEFLLQAARDMGAPIVTNDRFRDWAETFPDVATPANLVRGGYEDGALYLKH